MANPQPMLHYEIVEKLGEGGMGEVYKARDTRLDRFVALKLIRSSDAASAERRRRFAFEAKAASALNHPSIITIYDIGQYNGDDFIAMEYVAGQTLDQLIHGGGVKVADALEYAVQIADALSAAHRSGIVHRDLKPANIMVTGQGLVKVLDFGLAKLAGPIAPNATASTQTLDVQATGEGAIIGTVSYMSPEQAEGRPVDARSDIFSFGVVLYEMLSGRRAFEGETPLSILTAILHCDPAPLSELLPKLPPEVGRIVSRCLRKDPQRRWQTMDDVKIALEEVKAESAPRRKTVPLPYRRKSRVMGAVTFAFVLIVIAGGWWWKSRQQPTRTVQLTMRAITGGSGITDFPVLSNDGRLVAYASDRATQKNLDIWIHPLAKGAQPVRLTHDVADEYHPSFSPDGGLVAYRSERDGGGIHVVSTVGGEPRLLVRDGRRPRFSPDGKWVAYTLARSGFMAESRIFIVPVEGGASRQIAGDVPWAGAPVFSPDGRKILFTGAPEASPSNVDFWVADIDGRRSVRTGIMAALSKQGVRVELFEMYFISVTGAHEWVDNKIYVTSEGHVFSVELDPRTFAVAGPAKRVTNGAGEEANPRAVVVDGKVNLAFVAGGGTLHLWSLRVDAHRGKPFGAPEPVAYSGGAQWTPSATADGKKLAYIQREPGNDSVRVRDLASGKETTLLSKFARSVLSPDGAHVAYREGSAFYVLPSSGGEAKKLLDFKGSGAPYGWTPDSKKVVYWDGAPIRYSTLDVKNGQSAELLSHPKYAIHDARLSPDQRWIVFHTPVRNSILRIAPVRNGRAAGEAEWITVADRGVDNSRAWWSSDGNLLYFFSTLDGFWCIYAQRLAPATKKTVGEPFEVYHFDGRLRPRPSAFSGPAILPDRIILSVAERSSNVWLAQEN